MELNFLERQALLAQEKAEADRKAKAERMAVLRIQIRNQAPDLADAINLLRETFREKDGSLGRISVGNVTFLQNALGE